MRVYHFLNQKYGLEDLKYRHLKISRIKDLNDPFELLSPVGSDKGLRQAYHAIREHIDSRMGILCFSQSWRNPVQWSHYADRQRGLCLGFDVPDRLLQPVNYISKRPLTNPKLLFGIPGKKLLQSELNALLATKFSHWKYEKEIRHFVPYEERVRPKSSYFQPFCRGMALREVIVGVNSSIRRKEIERALKPEDSGVVVFKSRLAFQSFRIVRQRDEMLWN